MAPPPPYGASQYGSVQPAGEYGPSPLQGPEGRLYDPGRELDPQRQQPLVCTCYHPMTSSSAGAAPPSAAPALCSSSSSTVPGGHVVPSTDDGDGLVAPRCCCPADEGLPDRRRRSTSRGSNFSEDSLTGEPSARVRVSEGGARLQPVVTVGVEPGPVVMRTGGAGVEPGPVVMRTGAAGVARSPQKRRSLTQEYLAAQAAEAERRSSQLLQAELEAEGRPGQHLKPLQVEGDDGGAARAAAVQPQAQPAQHTESTPQQSVSTASEHQTVWSARDAEESRSVDPRLLSSPSGGAGEGSVLGEGAGGVVEEAVDHGERDAAGSDRAAVVSSETPPPSYHQYVQEERRSPANQETNKHERSNNQERSNNYDHEAEPLAGSQMSRSYVAQDADFSEPRPLSETCAGRPAASTPDLRRLSQYEDPSVAHEPARRRSQVYEDRPSGADLRSRLSQVYNEPMVSLSPETRRLSQVCDDSQIERGPSQTWELNRAVDPRRVSGVSLERPGYSNHTHHHQYQQHQQYDDRPASYPQRLPQAYVDHAAMSSYPQPDRRAAMPAYDQRRLSQPYDDRPESRRLSRPYDDRPDSRRLSQPYDDRLDSRRLSQPYDDRPDSRRLSQSYDDRPAAADSRRLSQPYDDRPASSDSRRLSQSYDDRPATADSKRLSQPYDDRPATADSKRLSQPYDDQSTTPEGRRYSHSPSYAENVTPETGGEGASPEGKSACEKYDDRPCTAAADRVLAVATVKPWWDQKPDRRLPAKTKPKDRSARRASTEKAPQTTSSTAAGDRLLKEAADPAGAGDTADDSPLAFTVDLGPTAGGAAAKKLRMKDSISRWAPRYRRSLSTNHKDEETRSDSGELVSGGSAVVRPRSLLRRRQQGGVGYHSEGYFSSDQDVDSRDKRITSRAGTGLPSRSPAAARTPSPRGVGGGAARLSAARRTTMTRAAAGTAAPVGLKKSATLGTMPARRQQQQQQQRQERESGEEQGDDVSEAGTYTIENEPEDEATQQGEAAFSGPETYDEDTVGRRRPSGGESSSNECSPDRDTCSSKPSAYSSGANWIEQWAAEVTKHNQENLKKTAQHASSATAPGASNKPPTGSSSPWSRHTQSPDGTGRPRRKLPTPPAVCQSPVTAAADKGRPAALSSSLDTESYLRTTQDVVCALQARLDAAADDDDASESASSGSSERPTPAAAARTPGAKPPSAAAPPTVDFKFNRALSLRRARLGLDDGAPPSTTKHRPTTSRSPARGGSARKLSDSEYSGPPPTSAGKKAANFARSDGGRFSLRMANGTAKTPPSRPAPSSSAKKPATGTRTLSGGPRAAALAAQATRDQEMANWKRRKNYDPLKAAKEARRKQTEPGGSQSDTTGGTAAPLRSASFHGTDGLGASLLRRGGGACRDLYQSEDETAVRRASPPVPHSRPQVAAPAADDSDLSEAFHDEVSASSSTRKVSLEGSRRSSPLFRSQAPSSLRNKVKLEALDNLVISTIHTLSSKIRGNSESLVSKLKCQFDEEDVRHTLLDDVMTTLTTDTPSSSKTASRDLAGILKNLRKVEQAVQVLEQVLCEEDEVSDGDDVTATDKFGDGFF